MSKRSTKRKAAYEPTYIKCPATTKGEFMVWRDADYYKNEETIIGIMNREGMVVLTFDQKVPDYAIEWAEDRCGYHISIINETKMVIHGK